MESWIAIELTEVPKPRKRVSFTSPANPRPAEPEDDAADLPEGSSNPDPPHFSLTARFQRLLPKEMIARPLPHEAASVCHYPKHSPVRSTKIALHRK